MTPAAKKACFSEGIQKAYREGAFDSEKDKR